MNTEHFICTDFNYSDFETDNIERYELTEIPIDSDSCELDYQELYEVPMMNCIRYFPSFVTFTDEDRRNVASATTLLYDIELDQWGVAMTGGGMDLSPHLLSTFIKLGHGIPLEIASAISSNYKANISENEHSENCKIVTGALNSFADTILRRAKYL